MLLVQALQTGLLMRAEVRVLLVRALDLPPQGALLELVQVQLLLVRLLVLQALQALLGWMSA